MAQVKRSAELDAQRLFEGFEELMPFRVHDILLVSSLYDSFILREDGRLNELLIGESLDSICNKFRESRMCRAEPKRWRGRDRSHASI